MFFQSAAPPDDWRALRDGSFTRNLAGGEILTEWLHQHRQGSGRIATGIDIQTDYGIIEAERRLRTAWLRTRFRHPLLGITFRLSGRGGAMSYAVFQDEEAALNWRRNTIVFLRENDFGSLEEIRHSLDNHNTHPADGHARLYVLARRNGRISLVLNASHALLDFASVTVVWQTLIDELALENQERIEWGVEVANLPRPIANVLSEAYPQSWFQWFKSMFDMVRALGNARAESIRLPLHPQHAERPPGTGFHTHIFTEEETTHFVKRCKEAKTTVTCAYIAIVALALQDLYGNDDEPSEQAQVFAMPYNARRWLPAGLPAVPPHSPSLGNTTAYIHVPHSGPPLRSYSCASEKERLALREARAKRILEFAEKYKEESSKAINSPTPGSVLASKVLVPIMVGALQWSDPEKPPGSLYVVISQGPIDKVFPSRANVEGSHIVVVDYRSGGRALDNNPLTTLYTWKGKMHIRHKYSSKFFDDKTFEDIHSKALEYLSDFVASRDLQVAADGKGPA